MYTRAKMPAHEELYGQAQRSWPDVHVPKDVFRSYVAARAGASAITPEAAAGLYVACACVRGDPRALRAFEEHYVPDLQVDPPVLACASCVEIGGTWVHLRQCLTCGRTGCCDLSPNRHATAHFRETGHPMIRTVQPGEDWLWCYPDDRLFQPALQPEGSR